MNKLNKKTKKKNLFLAVLSLLFLIILFFITLNYTKSVENKTQNKSTQIDTEEEKTLYKFNTEVFEDLIIEGKGFVVYDPRTESVIYQKNSNISYPLASMTKVMTIMLAYKVIPEKTIIKINSFDLEVEGDSGLKVGDSWDRDDLMSYTLSVSSNDGAHALARVGGEYITGEKSDYTKQVASFVEYMNKLALEYGFSSIVFKNESGLDINENEPAVVGNGVDVAKLFAKAYLEIPQIFETTTKSISYISSESNVYKAKNTNEAASKIPGLALSKTGYTDLADGNLGVVVEVSPGTPVVIVVMHSTKEGRFRDVEEIYNTVLKSMAEYQNGN